MPVNLHLSYTDNLFRAIAIQYIYIKLQKNRPGNNAAADF